MVPLPQSAKAKGGLLLPKGLLESTGLFPEPPCSLLFPQLSHSYCSQWQKPSHIYLTVGL